MIKDDTKGRIIPCAYPRSKCAGCRGILPYGEDIWYRPEAPRGLRAWHLDCVKADPQALAAKAAIAASEATSARLARGAARERIAEAMAAEREAIRAVYGWLWPRLHDPDERARMRRVLDALDGVGDRTDLEARSAQPTNVVPFTRVKEQA